MTARLLLLMATLALAAAALAPVASASWSDHGGW
jgi:hypothetical protein